MSQKFDVGIIEVAKFETSKQAYEFIEMMLGVRHYKPAVRCYNGCDRNGRKCPHAEPEIYTVTHYRAAWSQINEIVVIPYVGNHPVLLQGLKERHLVMGDLTTIARQIRQARNLKLRPRP